MIVASHTLEEIQRQIDMEHPAVVFKAKSIRLQVRSEMMKAPHNRSIRTVEYVSKSHNRWLMFFEMDKAKQIFRNANVLHYYDDYGIHTIKLIEYTSKSGTELYYQFQDGHFYRRYNQRLGLGLVKPLDVVKHFHKHNPKQTMSNEQVEEKEGVYRVFAVINDGVILGLHNRKEKTLRYKTFITNDMLGKRQIKTAEWLTQGRADKELSSTEDSDDGV